MKQEVNFFGVLNQYFSSPKRVIYYLLGAGLLVISLIYGREHIWMVIIGSNLVGHPILKIGDEAKKHGKAEWPYMLLSAVAVVLYILIFLLIGKM